MNVELTPDITAEDREFLGKLYEESFPAAERRDWNLIGAPGRKGQPYLYAIIADGHLAGLVTLWTFNRFAYIEHLAVRPDFRGHSVGSDAVKLIIEKVDPLPVVVEIEPPVESEPLTVKRAKFCSRLGFVTIDSSYIQPPYGPGLPSVPLHLLATTVLPANMTAATLRNEVYFNL